MAYEFLEDAEYNEKVQKMKDSSPGLKNAGNSLMVNAANFTQNMGKQYNTQSSPNDNVITISQENLDNPYSGYSEGPGSGPNTNGGGGFGNFVNSYGGMIGSAFGSMAGAFKPANEFNNDQYVDQVQVKEDARNESVGQVKDTVASVMGPYAQLFRGVEKMGNSLGDSMGGLEGSVVSGLFSGDEAIMAANSDPDIGTWDKIAGTLFSPYASYTSYNAKLARKRKAENAAFQSAHAKREQEQRMRDGEQQKANLMAARKMQYKYLPNNY